MNKTFPQNRCAGIFDAADVKLAVLPQEEVAFRKEVEASLPGQWETFRSACLSAAALLLAHQSNKTVEIKKTINNLYSLIQDVSIQFSELPPGGVGLFQGDTQELIAELVARVDLAEKKSKELNRSKPRLQYRDYLAQKIAEIMFAKNLTPSRVRDYSHDSWKGNSTYARLLRIGVILIEGKDPEDLFSYLKQGLNKAEATRPF